MPEYRYTTRAFGGLMARASALTIVEAENIVEIGEIAPMDIDLPGIYVDRIVPATVDKQIEILTLREEKAEAGAPVKPVKQDGGAKQRREKIARRAAKELKDGFYCNLGVGMPVLAASFLPEGTNVWLQSENGEWMRDPRDLCSAHADAASFSGILGMGPYPTKAEVDA